MRSGRIGGSATAAVGRMEHVKSAAFNTARIIHLGTLLSRHHGRIAGIIAIIRRTRHYRNITGVQLQSLLDMWLREKTVANPLSADWRRIVGNLAGKHLVHRMRSLRECRLFVAACPVVCCNCWCPLQDDEEEREYSGGRLYRAKRKVWKALIDKRGCECHRLFGLPAPCSFAMTSRYYNLHHAAQPCHGETDDFLSDSSISAEGFERDSISRATLGDDIDLLVMTEATVWRLTAQ